VGMWRGGVWPSLHRLGLDRRSLKKIDQAGKAAAQLADTRDSTASPLDRRGEADV